MSTVRSNCFSVKRQMSLIAPAVALLMRMSTVPNASTASPTMVSAPAKVAALADVWRPYGVRMYLCANFAAPVRLGGLSTADPLDQGVADWWKAKADEIYGLIPDFGGFLVKANSEGQPGPKTYGRTHAEGANVLADALAPHGYSVARAPMRDCLHLKTAVSTLPNGVLLLDPRYVDAGDFDGARSMHVDPDEPEAANVLVVGDVVVLPSSAPKTRALLAAAGYETRHVNASELAKAEGGLTCCSLLLR